MADKKISALTGASTPLAGTEVLPIVQSGSTVKVSVENLTAGRAVAALSAQLTNSSGNVEPLVLSSGNIGVVGNTIGIRAGYTGNTYQKGGLIYQSDDGNGRGSWLICCNDGANSNNVTVSDAVLKANYSGNVTLNKGNLVQGTAAKGINFTANTPAAGMTSQLLNWYEEGTWTPSVGGNATYTGQLGKYTRIGRAVHVQMDLTINVLGTGSTTTVSGLPFTSNDYYALSTGFFFGIASNVVFISPVVQSGATNLVFYTLTAAGASTGSGTAVLGDGARIQITGTYFV